MEITNINPSEVIFALDIGTRSVIGTVGVIRDKKFHVISENYVEHQERAMIDGQIHDITLVASAVDLVKKELEKSLGFKLTKVAIAAAGRFLRTVETKVELQLDYEEIDKDVIRGLELTAVKKAEEEINKHTEGKLYCVGYSVKSYYLNGYVISNLTSHKGDNIGADVISTFLPRSVVESLYAVMDKVGLTVINLTLEPIAAMEAAIPQNLRLLNLALVDIGAGTSDVAICSKDTITAYGMASVAGDEVTELVAQNYLVDFNTAEKIKRQCSDKDTIQYTDILGIENEISREEVVKGILPVVQKLADEISSKIIELNGNKSPNAVFLVGGGAHTPSLKDILAEKLNLPPQRIAIKGRDAVSECVCLDNSLGSTGVTVLGIALVSIKKLGQDFIDVYLNSSVVSLFNSHNNTVMDAIIQAGINPKVLMGKNGKNIKFLLNGIKRVAFGTLASNAVIKVNGIVGNMDTEIRERDEIEIDFAVDGKNAEPKVKEYIQAVNSTSFFINDEIINMEPTIFINDKKAELDEIINEDDNVRIIYPETLLDFKKYFETGDYDYLLNGTKLKDDYVIKEGQRIYRIEKEYEESVEALEENIDIDESEEENNISDTTIKQEKEEIKGELKRDKAESYGDIKQSIDMGKNSNKIIAVIANDMPVVLKNKEKYVFIDIFDYIDFDLTRVKGNLTLMLNGKKAGYYDELSEGDNIKVYWE